MARSSALFQPARNFWRSSPPIFGSKVRSEAHCGGDFVRRFVKTDSQSCQVRRTHCSCLWIRRTHHWHTQEICLSLHQEVVGAGAAVNPKFGKFDRRIGFHRGEEISNLKSDAFESSSSNVRSGTPAGQSEDGTPGVRIPMRSPESDKSGHQIHTAIVRDACRQTFNLRRRLDDSETVTQPLHDRSGNEDAAFECVFGYIVLCATQLW